MLVHRSSILLFLMFGSLFCLDLPAQANSACSLPAIEVRTAKDNLFTEVQENELGDIVAEQWEQGLTILHNDALAQHLREVSAKVVAQLPTTMRYHFELVELEQANAFSLPGGRIYISRKIIALAQSDDEIAGLIAHELGHEVTHQGAALISRIFHQLFGITSVSGPEEIRVRYHQMLDLQARTHVKIDREEDEQLAADRIAIEAMTRAGYNPAAFAALFNRLTETRNGKSSFFADLFGSTPPDVARFRKLQKIISSFPASCVAQQAPLEPFRKWQAEVVAFDRRASAHSSFPGLISERELKPALRPDVTNIRYSADGKYLLVQDSGTIQVLTRDPLERWLQIAAPKARPAQFSADGESVSFYIGSSDPRIETWSVASKQRLSVHELHTKNTCAQAELSNDGKYFACLARNETDYNLAFSLTVYEVISGSELLRSPNIIQVQGLEALLLELQLWVASTDIEHKPLVYLHFSPDVRYLIAARDMKTLVYDLSQRAPMSVAGALKSKLQNGFGFLTPDRVIVRKESTSALAEIRSFPDGRLIKEGIKVGNGYFGYSADPNFALLRFPFSEGHPLVAVDLNQNKVAVGYKTAAGDVHGTEFASERRDGEIAIDELETGTPRAKIDLRESPLGEVQAFAASDDLSWVTYSDRTRGGLWSLHTGIRVYHLRGFSGSFIDNNFLHADMPKHEKSPRAIAHMSVMGNSVTATEISDDEDVGQYGAVLLVKKSDKSRGKLTATKYGSWNTLEARDVATQKPLWTKVFAKQIDTFYVRPSSDSIAYESHEKDKVRLEFHRLSTGSDLGTVTIRTNQESFRVNDAKAAGDFLLVADNERRVTVYDKGGIELARLFGTDSIGTASGDALAITAEAQQVVLYDLRSRKKLSVLEFPQRLLSYRFDAAGNKLLVVTADQVAYLFDVQKLRDTAASSN